MENEVLSFMMPINIGIVIMFVGLFYVGFELWRYYSED